MEKKLEVARYYDETSRRYERRYAEIQNKKYRILLAHSPRGRKVLDLGCGTGMLLRRIKGDHELVVGIDISLGMLRKARKEVPDVPLILADADHLPFGDECFDAVFSVTVLQNLPDPLSALREVVRVTKPGGRVLVSTLKRKHSKERVREWVKELGLREDEILEREDVEDVLLIATRTIEDRIK